MLGEHKAESRRGFCLGQSAAAVTVVGGTSEIFQGPTGSHSPAAPAWVAPLRFAPSVKRHKPPGMLPMGSLGGLAPGGVSRARPTALQDLPGLQRGGFSLWVSSVAAPRNGHFFRICLGSCRTHPLRLSHAFPLFRECLGGASRTFRNLAAATPRRLVAAAARDFPFGRRRSLSYTHPFR